MAAHAQEPDWLESCVPGSALGIQATEYQAAQRSVVSLALPARIRDTKDRAGARSPFLRPLGGLYFAKLSVNLSA
ncbi:hypothetical protein [Amycolatopsis vastitatis]|uniref:hypothetical protein n=1 Tax=Amycolatopsis vastitatis TaxID=1905142 RepID=UPI001177FCDD|nr:hypothetical protein [Amycolatopsis vastitatis]